jgi:hypothetical protein
MRRVLNPRTRNPFDTPLICKPAQHFVDPPPGWNGVPVAAGAFPGDPNPRFVTVSSNITQAAFPVGFLFQIQTDGFPPIFAVNQQNNTTLLVQLPQLDSQEIMRCDLMAATQRVATLYFRPPHYPFP